VARKFLVVLGVLGVVALSLQCARFGKKPKVMGEITPAERALIAAFTQGVISRESPIRVVFTRPMVEPSELNTPLGKSPFRFDPKIEGVAVWTAVDEIELRPQTRLPDGETYGATLELQDLLGGQTELDHFYFVFSTMKQSFQVAVDGLEAADPQDPKAQRLSGKLVTADVDDAARVEPVVRATQGGRDLAVDWTHEPDRRVHRFVVTGIERTDGPGTLFLSWDGTPLGVVQKETQKIEVPGLSTFSVHQARAVQGQEQYIELRFTDPLQQRQDLRGLIQVGDRTDLRFTVSGSIVQVFSAAGFTGAQTVQVASGIRNTLGYRMPEPQELTVEFELLKPQVRFAGKGAILPTGAGLTLPIEAVNLRAITVQAMAIPDRNIPQFLQVNDLEGEQELNRVGRVVWSKTVPLDITPDKEGRFVPFGLDLSPLAAAHPGGMYRLTLSFKRPHILWPCPAPAGQVPDEELSGFDDEQESSFWDFWGDNEGGYWDGYQNREDPCHPGYYRSYYDHDIEASRNVLISDLGLIAKAGEDDSVLVIATDLATTDPVSGADVALLDYQQQTLARATTDRQGLARLPIEGKPYLAVVHRGSQAGYLRLDDGSALSMSQFDVAGASVPKGLKGFLYGERGVWRPGDTLHLTFILLDPEKRLPADHPVRFELQNSRGQPVKVMTRPRARDGFHVFEVATAPDAPTGNYTARVRVGGATFEKVVKVETVMPNRLKIALDFGTDMIEPDGRLETTLTSTWLHGATARNLKADVEVALHAARTRFERYADYVFDDPTRSYQAERQNVFEGQLDEKGQARIETTLSAQNVAPGQLSASFTTRVFEPGGAFSVDRFSIPYSPYETYVGVRVPKGDKARGMLLTDTKHEVGIVAVDPHGQPVKDAEVEVRLYKLGWRWWWEKGEEDLSAFAESSVNQPLQEGTVKLPDGTGSWNFEIKYPDWGRYLITVADQGGEHRTGQVLYVDWPGWAGRGQKEMTGGATVLAFTADKPEYAVGETVTLTIPTPAQGRALLSIESGSKVLRTEWLEVTGTETQTSFPATAEMAPNVYAHVTLLQPHGQTGNDLPIRLYGVVPIKVVDPTTRLAPVVECADVLVPETTAKIAVREASGRPMSYTLAVVDEGLLSLTRYKVPNPWDHFYAREALSVRTWDVYDLVIGAYGAAIERMLAIGGDEAGGPEQAKRANRFPPMVRFLGPFQLAPGGKNVHDVDIPQYVGAVRAMVVAGHEGAFGAAERSAFVRKPLMVLGTLPRVLGPQEEVALPVSVFALEPTVKDVQVEVTTSGPLEVVAPATRGLSFQEPGDELVSFRLRTRPSLGVAKAVIRARGAGQQAEQQIELDVRSSTRRVTDVVGVSLEPTKSWEKAVKLPGLGGTNEVTLEVSRIPPLDLGRRLAYLIHYPHGCVEQTVSSVFPQLYLGRLLELQPLEKARIEANVKAGLERLKQFQTSEGGFGYWPGDNDPNDWASSYAGHFMVEAQNAGYLLPAGLLEQWKSFQERRARAWVASNSHAELVQAYRLYGLALAQAPDLGSMNRLRESTDLPVVARWRLAAAYQLAGQPEAARALVGSVAPQIAPYRELAGTFGSDLRDKAMVLESLAILKMGERIGPLAKEISERLSRNDWMSTQETAYALMALARCAGEVDQNARFAFSLSWAGGDPVTVSSTAALIQKTLEAGDRREVQLSVHNTGSVTVFPRLLMSGLPPVGQETSASNGMTLEVEYLDLEGNAIDPARLEQGTDFKVRASVRNTGVRGDYEEVALSQVFASGFEIHNERLDPTRRPPGGPIEYQDVRDDRVLSYFDLKAGETKTIEVLLNASYLGRFYQPMVAVEAMYDATLNARTAGQWVEVVEPGK